MAFLFRCPECRTRRRDYGLFTKHLKDSGHKLCRCGGYHYSHRPDSPFCHQNPYSVALEASRAGTSDEEVEAMAAQIALEIAVANPGRKPRPTDPVKRLPASDKPDTSPPPSRAFYCPA